MSNKTMSLNDLSKELKNRDDHAKVFQENVLSKADDTTAAKEEQKAKDEVLQKQQKEAIDMAVAASPRQLTTRIPRKDRAERAHDNVKAYLLNFKEAKIGSNEKVEALQKVLEVVNRYPKKQVLDEIYKFFVENKKEDFLNPKNALQNTANIEKTSNIKIRVLYEVMYSLAHGTATKKTISLEVIRNIFKSDDFVNWVAVNLPKR